MASVALNVLLNSLLVFVLHWGAFSIAVATSVAAWFNYFYLSRHLTKQMVEPLLDRAVFRSFFKTGSCALVAAVSSLLVGHFFIGDPTLRLAGGGMPWRGLPEIF